MIFNVCVCILIVLIYIITHISKKNTKINNNLFLFFSFFLLFFFVAFRKTSIGNDTMEYIRLFKSCNLYKWNYLSINSRYEFGYIIFNIILSYISSNTRFFMIIMSFIFNYSVYKFIKENSKNYLFSIIIYINLLFFYQSMTMMRQFLALSILLLSFNFVKEKKLLKYSFMVLFASLFHTTALLGIFIYPMYYMKFNKKRILAFSIITVIVIMFMDKIFPYIATITNRSDFYSQTIGEAKLANIVYFLIYLTFFIFSMFIVSKNDQKLNNFYLYSFIFSALFYAISINTAVLARAVQYFAIFSIISLPNIIYYNIKETRLIYEIIISLFLILYSSIVMIYRPEWNSAYNYKSCIGNWYENECE